MVAVTSSGPTTGTTPTTSRAITVTAIQPPGRYGALNMEGDRVGAFQEKPAGDGAWINGGFFVLNPSVIDYIDGDQSSWEGEPLTQLAEQNQLMAFRHRGFWQAMDTLRDKNQLNDLWYSGEAPWRVAGAGGLGGCWSYAKRITNLQFSPLPSATPGKNNRPIPFQPMVL